MEDPGIVAASPVVGQDALVSGGLKSRALRGVDRAACGVEAASRDVVLDPRTLGVLDGAVGLGGPHVAGSRQTGGDGAGDFVVLRSAASRVATSEVEAGARNGEAEIEVGDPGASIRAAHSAVHGGLEDRARPVGAAAGCGDVEGASGLSASIGWELIARSVTTFASALVPRTTREQAVVGACHHVAGLETSVGLSVGLGEGKRRDHHHHCCCDEKSER